MSVNRNKKSVTLNLKAPEGRKIFQALARKSDVLLENFRPGTMDKLGFGYQALARLNPRLVYCSVSGFGEIGPRSPPGRLRSGRSRPSPVSWTSPASRTVHP